MARGIFGKLFGGKADETRTPEDQGETPAESAPETPADSPIDAATLDHSPQEVAPDDATVSKRLASDDTATATEASSVAPDIAAAPEAGLSPDAKPVENAGPEDQPEPEQDPEPITEIAPVAGAEPGQRSWFQRLTGGLSKSSSALKDALVGIVAKRKLDDDTLQDLEDVLIASDLGVETAMTITEALAKGRYDKEIEESEIRAVLAEEVAKVLAPVALPLDVNRGHNPHVVLVVGVNGTGKTTTIGKLAARLKADGKSVLLAAGDTFRAAAIDQLKIWGTRVDAPVVARETGADAAGLAFDALDQAIETGTDVVLIDTAGRLQNKADLMAELEKVIRVIQKKIPDAPHDVVLVLDATTGQNALKQVEIFGKVAGVTGLVMTKLDGTARGGILVAISAKYQMPVHAIGVGEGVDDFQPFDADEFARAIAGLA
jgi:fused signal recognition particle receptor